MSNTTKVHPVPVATPAEIFRGWDGIYSDDSGDLYIVPVDPASLDDSDCCQ